MSSSTLSPIDAPYARERSDLSYFGVVALLEETLADSDQLPANLVEFRERMVRILGYLKHGTMRVGEAADHLGVSENTIKNWVRGGRFPSSYQTEGGHWRLRTSEVMALLDAQRRLSALNEAGHRRRQDKFAGDPFADAPDC